MKIFDFNIHLPAPIDQGVNDRVATEMNASNSDLIQRAEATPFIADIDGGNFMIFNSSLFLGGDDFLRYTKSKVPTASYTLLIDFRAENVYQHIDEGIAAGIDCIKFHSYQQRIDSSCYEKIIELCKYAESKSLIICLDASYGTQYMVKYDIVDFICAVANQIDKTPIVVLHSGGLKCLNMYLLAADKENVYLETSASLPVYMGSSIEQDLAFMYKKLPDNRVLFASDDPYFEHNSSVELAQNFFRRHNFNDGHVERIFYQNAIDLLNH